MVICAPGAQAQSEKVKKKEKKVVIVKKQIDEDGNETIEKRVLKGGEAAEFDLDDLENVDISIDEKVIKIDDEEIEIDSEGATEKRVRIMAFDSDSDEISPEVLEKLKKEGIDVESLMSEGEEGAKRVWIQKDGEEIEIDDEKIVMIHTGEGETEIEKEVIIIDGDDKETKTDVRIIKKKMGGDKMSKNSLEIDNLNLNMESDGKTDVLTITASTKTKGATTVRVIDSAGKSVFEEEIKKYKGKFTRKVNLEKAAPGALFLTITQGDKVFTELLPR